MDKIINEKNGNRYGVLAFCIAVICFFALILIIPVSRSVFEELTASHPFIMSFFKFALLATVGELIALKMSGGVWKLPGHVIVRALIWGVLGMLITMAFKIFGAGVAAALESGIIPGGMNFIWKAFMTSFWCNLFFAPFMMGTHKLTDTWLELIEQGQSGITPGDIAAAVDFRRFVSFTMLKTIPFFWIPAHTITFMLPVEYQAIMAAGLSVALGIILNMNGKRK